MRKSHLIVGVFALLGAVAAQAATVNATLGFPYAINPDVAGTRTDLIKVHSTIIPLNIVNTQVYGATAYTLQRCALRTGTCTTLKSGTVSARSSAYFTDTRFSGLVDPGEYQSQDWMAYQGRYGGVPPMVTVCVISSMKVTDPKCPAKQTIKMPVSQYFVNVPLAQAEYRLTTRIGNLPPVVTRRLVNVYY